MVPPRVDQAEAQALYQGILSWALPLPVNKKAEAHALYQGMASAGFSRAVGGSHFRALAPAAFLLARYVKQ